MFTVKSADGIELPLPTVMMVHFTGGKPVNVRTINENEPGVWQEWPVEYYIIFGAEMLMHPEEYTVIDNLVLNGTIEFINSDEMVRRTK